MKKTAAKQPSSAQNADAVQESHPYDMFYNSDTEYIIIGTFPASEFTSNPPKIDAKCMINFFYGRLEGKGSNLLWKLLGDVFECEMTSEEMIKSTLTQKRIGVADVCARVIRKIPGNAEDKNLIVTEWNHTLCDLLNSQSQIKELFFTSRNAKDWYEKNIKSRVLRPLKETTLISPSKAANLYIAGTSDYKNSHSDDLYSYRLKLYREAFLKK